MAHYDWEVTFYLYLYSVRVSLSQDGRIRASWSKALSRNRWPISSSAIILIDESTNFALRGCVAGPKTGDKVQMLGRNVRALR